MAITIVGIKIRIFLARESLLLSLAPRAPKSKGGEFYVVAFPHLSSFTWHFIKTFIWVLFGLLDMSQ